MSSSSPGVNLHFEKACRMTAVILNYFLYVLDMSKSEAKGRFGELQSQAFSTQDVPVAYIPHRAFGCISTLLFS